MGIGIMIGMAVVLVPWAITCWRRLKAMNEDVNYAMVQINRQLSSCFDALTALLDVTKEYAAREAQILIETIRSQRKVNTAVSTQDDVLKQRGIIAESLDFISVVAEQYPELKTHKNYARCMKAMNRCEEMVNTSQLIYNSNVTRLNRELRIFPISLLAGLFDVRQRDYLVAAEGRENIITIDFKCGSSTEIG